MAFDPNEKDPNQQQQNPNQPITSSAPGSGPGSAVGKSSAPQATPSQPFQNLSAYLTANAPQVQEQAGKISDNLNNQYVQIQNDINKGKSDFGQQVTSGYASPNKDLVESAAKNPSPFASDPNNVKAFQSLYNDQYTGPDAFEKSDAYGSLNQNVNKAVSDASQMTSVPGLETYFQKNNPNATRGGNLLDSVLLQGNQDAYGNVIKAAKQYSGLPDYLSGAVSDADQSVTNAKQTAQQTAQDVQNQFTGENGVIPNYQKDFNDRLALAKQNSLNRSSDVFGFLKNLTQQNAPYNDQILKDLGMTQNDAKGLAAEHDILSGYKDLIDPATNQPYYGGDLDLTRYATQLNPDAAITPDSFASPEDYQNALALSQLTGENIPLLDQSQSANAGKNPLNLVQFNKDSTNQELNNAVKDQDSFLAKQALGVDINNPDSVKNLLPYLNNLFSGKLPYSSDRQKAAVQALIRQGVFVPSSPPPSVGGSGFTDPTSGRRVV